MSGGNSINSIPQSATIDADLHSVTEDGLEQLASLLSRSVDSAVAGENARAAATGTRLESEVTLIGDRPSGETAVDSMLVQIAIEASLILGISPRLDRASTDSNIPMSLGISAITIGGGGVSENIHTLHEWHDPTDRDVGLKRALFTVLGMAGRAEC